MTEDQFEQLVAELVAEFEASVKSRAGVLDLVDFCVWALVQQGHEHGRRIGYREGLAAAAALVARTIPDVTERLPVYDPDDATTVIQAAVPAG